MVRTTIGDRLSDERLSKHMADNDLARIKAMDPVPDGQDPPEKVRLNAWMDRRTYEEIVAGFGRGGLKMNPAEALRLVCLGFARIEGMRREFREGLHLAVLERSATGDEDDGA